ASSVSERIAIGRPGDAEDADVIVNDLRFGAIGERANDQIAATRAARLRAESSDRAAAHEGDSRTIRGGEDVALGGGRGPHGGGGTAAGADFPEIAAAREIDGLRVAVPESTGDLAFGEVGERDGRGAAFCTGEIEILDAAFVPDESDVFAVGRPDGFGRMFDLDDLFDGEFRSGLGAGRGAKQEECRDSEE